MNATRPLFEPDWDGDSQFSRQWWRETQRMVDRGFARFCRKRGWSIGLTLKQIKKAEYEAHAQQKERARQQSLCKPKTPPSS